MPPSASPEAQPMPRSPSARTFGMTRWPVVEASVSPTALLQPVATIRPAATTARGSRVRIGDRSRFEGGAPYIGRDDPSLHRRGTLGAGGRRRAAHAAHQAEHGLVVDAGVAEREAHLEEAIVVAGLVGLGD